MWFKLRLAEHVDQNTSSNGGADNTGNVGTHGVHEQVVAGCTPGRLSARAAIGTAETPRNLISGADSCRGDDAHDLAQDDAASGADTESNDAQDDDLDGLDVQEGRSVAGAANREAQEDG